MIKVYIFNKSNNVSRFDIFKKFFECVNSEMSLTCCTKTDVVYQNVLDSKRRMANLTWQVVGECAGGLEAVHPAGSRRTAPGQGVWGEAPPPPEAESISLLNKRDTTKKRVKCSLRL